MFAKMCERPSKQTVAKTCKCTYIPYKICKDSLISIDLSAPAYEPFDNRSYTSTMFYCKIAGSCVSLCIYLIQVQGYI